MTGRQHGLYGTETQRRLQAATLAKADELRETPGAVFAARMSGTDDPERFGWDRITEVLRDEGAITFRMVPVDRCPDIERKLAEIGCAVTWWNVFDGPRDTIRETCEGILAGPRRALALAEPADADDTGFLEGVQAFMAGCGIAPYPMQVLSGRMGPAALAVLTDPEDGTIAATAFSYLPYNRHSAHRNTAWAGLVAVREDMRKSGIGMMVNAHVLLKSVTVLGADRVQEYARASNVPSCRMIERCGLRLRAEMRSGIAQPVGTESFTR